MPTGAARWAAQFHPLVTKSIDKLTYRQFNYQRLMKCRSQLTRWLLSQLVLKFTQASMVTLFEVRFSTVKRDSGLLGGYKLARQAVAALDESFNELKELGALSAFDKSEQRGVRAKLEDVIYTLFPSRDFTAEQKAANHRQAKGGVDSELSWPVLVAHQMSASSAFVLLWAGWASRRLVHAVHSFCLRADLGGFSKLQRSAFPVVAAKTTRAVKNGQGSIMVLADFDPRLDEMRS